jgi:hypothetical protein
MSSIAPSAFDFALCKIFQVGATLAPQPGDARRRSKAKVAANPKFLSSV